MAWHLQTPGTAGPKLLAHILTECGPAVKAGAAFAFASAQGVKLLAAEPVFQAFLKAYELVAIVGLDAITDTRAVAELKKLSVSRPNFKPKLFLHKTPGSIFHPKTMWLKTAKGGVIITGSGNLTSGGLKSNWEAMSIETLTLADMAAAEKSWDAWVKAHSKELLDPDDPKVKVKAEANKRLRVKIKKALMAPEAETAEVEAEIDAAVQVVEEVEQELLLNPVLIAEVPGGGRWKQVGFSLEAYQQFFGVTLGTKKYVQFHQVKTDGTLHPAENPESVEVKSKNYRFEIGAAQGLSYPKSGQPIVVFEKIGNSEFKYILRMPGHSDHTRIQKFLDANYTKTRAKRRIQITTGDLAKFWPTAPFFL